MGGPRHCAVTMASTNVKRRPPNRGEVNSYRHRAAADANPINPRRRPTQHEFACMHRVAADANTKLLHGPLMSSRRQCQEATQIHMHVCRLATDRWRVMRS